MLKLFFAILQAPFSYFGGDAGELVSWHARVVGGAEVIVGDVDVGVAHAAVLELELDVLGSDLVALDPDVAQVQYNRGRTNL